MTFRVTILGSGSAVPSVTKHHSAHVLNVHEQFYLVDCGEGTQVQLSRYGVNPLKVNHIFISHLHGDHVFGLFGLISTLGFLGKETPLHVYGPPLLGDVLQTHCGYFEPRLPYELLFVPVDPRKHACIYENKVLEVYSLPLRHSVPCTGYLFREKTPPRNIHKALIEEHELSLAEVVAIKNGADLRSAMGTVIPNSSLTYIPYVPRSYAYCSDTSYSAKLAGLVHGVDLLYHEATFAEEDRAMAPKTGHSTVRQAAKVATLAEARKLVIGHFSARYKEDERLLQEAREVFPATELAREGVSFEVPIDLFERRRKSIK